MTKLKLFRYTAIAFTKTLTCHLTSSQSSKMSLLGIKSLDPGLDEVWKVRFKRIDWYYDCKLTILMSKDKLFETLKWHRFSFEEVSHFGEDNSIECLRYCLFHHIFDERSFCLNNSGAVRITDPLQILLCMAVVDEECIDPNIYVSQKTVDQNIVVPNYESIHANYQNPDWFVYDNIIKAWNNQQNQYEFIKNSSKSALNDHICEEALDSSVNYKVSISTSNSPVTSHNDEVDHEPSDPPATTALSTISNTVYESGEKPSHSTIADQLVVDWYPLVFGRKHYTDWSLLAYPQWICESSESSTVRSEYKFIEPLLKDVRRTPQKDNKNKDTFFFFTSSQPKVSIVGVSTINFAVPKFMNQKGGIPLDKDNRRISFTLALITSDVGLCPSFKELRDIKSHLIDSLKVLEDTWKEDTSLPNPKFTNPISFSLTRQSSHEDKVIISAFENSDSPEIFQRPNIVLNRHKYHEGDIWNFFRKTFGKTTQKASLCMNAPLSLEDKLIYQSDNTYWRDGWLSVSPHFFESKEDDKFFLPGSINTSMQLYSPPVESGSPLTWLSELISKPFWRK